MKTCRKCQKEKPLEEFWKDKYAKDGKRPICRGCLCKYKHKDIRCYFCKEWFTKKYERHKFCNPKCFNRHWSKVMAQRMSKTLYGAQYRKAHDKQEKERHRKWYWENKDQILARRKELRKNKKTNDNK